VPYLLANNLLVLNHCREIEANRDAGRNHLPIAYGTGVNKPSTRRQPPSQHWGGTIAGLLPLPW